MQTPAASTPEMLEATSPRMARAALLKTFMFEVHELETRTHPLVRPLFAPFIYFPLVVFAYSDECRRSQKTG